MPCDSALPPLSQFSYNVVIKMKASSSVRPQKPFPSVPPPGAEELFSPLTVGIIAVAVAAGVMAIYSPALNFQFVLDDHRFVGDPRLQSPGHAWEYFTSYVWAQVPGGPLSFYRPLFVVWLRLNFILSETSPWGWHLLSVVKHLSVAVLLGLLVWRLLGDRVAALVVGTLFALHPAHTESVAWVTVPDPLMAAALLVSLLLYLEYAERASAREQSDSGKSHGKSRKHIRSKSTSRPSAAWLIASLAAFMAALMAKETAIVWPMVLFVMILIVPFDKPKWGKASHEDASFRGQLGFALGEIVPFLTVTVLYLLLRFNALGGHLSPATQHLTSRTELLSWPSTLWFYVKVLFWPVRSRAFADPTLAETFSLRGVVLPALGVGCVAAIFAWGCWWAWEKAGRDFRDREVVGIRRALLLGACILVFPILLTLNLNALNPGDFLHGRYTYLPLTGLMILIATGWHLSTKRRAILLSVTGLVAVAFGVLTVRQESAWKDDLTLFAVAHQNAPHNEPVARNLGRARVQVALGLDEGGRCDQAVPVFEDAIQQYPQDWFAWAGLGECSFKLNDLPKAEQSLRRAFELSHEPRVREEWQAVREKMGLASASAD
jgi:protein O-mannosyl-transferase